jgi:two-component system, LytTR family, sensor kinase
MVALTQPGTRMAGPIFSVQIDTFLLDPRYRTWRYGLYWSVAGLSLVTGLWDASQTVTRRVEPTGWLCAFTFEVVYALAVLLAMTVNLTVLIPRLLLRQRLPKHYLAWVLSISLVFSSLDMMPFGYKTRGGTTLTVVQVGLEVLEGVVFIASLLISVAGLKLLKTWIDERDRIRQLQTNSLLNELAALKAQINPHFLFNSLNNIHVLAKLRSPRTADAIVSLSELMRYQLQEGTTDQILLEHEIGYVENLLLLERLRRQSLDSQLTVRGLNGQRIAPFLLLPFIENAFKHGAAATADSPPFIHITIEADAKTVRFRVENSYVCSTKPTGTTGIGLANVQRRLDLLYPGRYQLAIDPAGCRFTVALTLMLSTDHSQPISLYDVSAR